MTPNFILLYVQDAVASCQFYQRLLQQPPVEHTDNFALFVLENGLKLGVWAANEVLPPVQSCTGHCELGIAVASRADVDEVFLRWQNEYTVLQTPTAMDFGYTFTINDPDGHRIRVFCPEDEAQP